MAKKCNRCDEIKPLTDFSVSRSNKEGYNTLCKACVVLRNKEYWRTPPGRLSQIYTAQNTVSKQRKHLLPAYTRLQLSEWAIEQGYNSLWLAWHKSGYDKNLVPSVDRLNPNEPYTLSNIRLVTWAENNDKAYEDRKECRHITKQNRRIEQLTLNGAHVAFFDSIASAARKTNITRVNINDVCKGKKHCFTAGGFKWIYVESKEKK